MAVGRQDIKGTKILNEINSSNIVRTEYDTADKTMITEFKNGTRYEYEEVPHNVYAEFRLSESQGKYFNQTRAHMFQLSETVGFLAIAQKLTDMYIYVRLKTEISLRGRNFLTS